VLIRISSAFTYPASYPTRCCICHAGIISGFVLLFRPAWYGRPFSFASDVIHAWFGERQGEAASVLGSVLAAIRQSVINSDRIRSPLSQRFAASSSQSMRTQRALSSAAQQTKRAPSHRFDDGLGVLKGRVRLTVEPPG
jgi:hypothetical protein